MPSPALVQKSGTQVTTLDTTISRTLTGVAAGNTLIAIVGYPNTSPTDGVTEVTDDKGNTWHEGDFEFDAGYGHHNYYWAENVAAGTTVITATFKTAHGGSTVNRNYRTIIVHEVSGLLSSGAFDQSAFRHNTVSEAITPLTDNQYIITAVWIQKSNGTPTAVDSGFTFQLEVDAGGGSYCLATADLVQNPAATVDPAFTFSGSPPSGWQQFIASFRPASPGASPAALSSAGASTVSLVGNLRAGAALAASGAGTTAFVGADAQPPVQRNYMSKGDTFENDWLKLIFNATPIANIADNAASSPLTQLFVALHTADPGEAGVQTTNETAYVGYARQAVNRNSGGWTVTGASVSPAANIDFPVCTSTPGSTITHASVGVAISGGSKILYSGPLSPNIAIAVGVIPRMTTASTITED